MCPSVSSEVSARRGSDVAYYLRLGVCRGGPLLAQVAAYGLALTAGERVTQPPEARDLELRRTRRALAEARPSARLPIWAMERMERCQADLGDAADGHEVAAALRAQADTIAAELQAAQAAIAGGARGVAASIRRTGLSPCSCTGTPVPSAMGWWARASRHCASCATRASSCVSSSPRRDPSWTVRAWPAGSCGRLASVTRSSRMPRRPGSSSRKPSMPC